MLAISTIKMLCNRIWNLLSFLEHMRTAGETVDFSVCVCVCVGLCVCVTNDWTPSSPVESVCKCYTSHMSEPKLPARALHETGTPIRSARLPGIYWAPAGGLHADRMKSSSTYQTEHYHHTISSFKYDYGATLWWAVKISTDLKVFQ